MAKMRAMIINSFGGPEVFEQSEVEKPFAGLGEILVKVIASSVNPVDFKIRQNGSWAGIIPPAVIGYDVAGIVEEVGAGVKRFKIGDEVFYSPLIFGGQGGSYGEYHVTNENIVAHKPKNITFEEAACLPLAGCTAHDVIYKSLKVRLGQTVLIHAGAGGVGSLAIQMAKAAGAKVYATCSVKNTDFVASLGADAVIDYKAENYTDRILQETAWAGIDAVFDTVGGDTLAKSLYAVKSGGRLASIVNSTGDLNPAYMKNQQIHFNFMERDYKKMEALKVLVENGQLKAVIDSVFPLEQIRLAHEKIEAGGVRGKIVIKI